MISLPEGPFCEDVIVDDSPSPASAGLRLCNFATGQSNLLDTHRAALYERIITAGWEAAGAWIDVIGYASKRPFRNDSSGNWGLSVARCSAVQDYLQKNYLNLFSSKVPFRADVSEGYSHRLNVVAGRGDSQSGNDPTSDHNHGFYRAVELRLFTQGKYTWKPTPVRRGTTTVGARRFEFEASEIASVDANLIKPLNAATGGANCLIFGIHDMQNLRRRYFWFGGLEFSVGIPKTPAISFSAEHKSTPVPFQTDVPILDLEDFTGTGLLTGDPGLTVGTYSAGGALTLSWTPKAYEDRGISTPVKVRFSFSSGFGVGLGMFGPGRVSLLSTSFRPTVYPR